MTPQQNPYGAHLRLLAERAAEQMAEAGAAQQAQRRGRRRRAIWVWTGAGMFSAAFLAPSALLPFSDTTPMLVTVGVAVPTGVGFVLMTFINHVATKDDVRVKRTVQPERIRAERVQ